MCFSANTVPTQVTFTPSFDNQRKPSQELTVPVISVAEIPPSSMPAIEY